VSNELNVAQRAIQLVSKYTVNITWNTGLLFRMHPIMHSAMQSDMHPVMRPCPELGILERSFHGIG
jgi:hypothetical protein